MSVASVSRTSPWWPHTRILPLASCIFGEMGDDAVLRRGLSSSAVRRMRRHQSCPRLPVTTSHARNFSFVRVAVLAQRSVVGLKTRSCCFQRGGHHHNSQDTRGVFCTAHVDVRGCASWRGEAIVKHDAEARPGDRRPCPAQRQISCLCLWSSAKVSVRPPTSTSGFFSWPHLSCALKMSGWSCLQPSSAIL